MKDKCRESSFVNVRTSDVDMIFPTLNERGSVRESGYFRLGERFQNRVEEALLTKRFLIESIGRHGE